MTEVEYREIKAELRAEGAFETSTAWGLLTVGVELVLYGVAFALLLMVPVLSLPWFGLQLFLGWSMLRFYVIVHECGHKSLFRTRTGCTIAGTIASVFCGVPYIPWREVHNLHHKWVGVIDRDPTQQGLLKLKHYSPAKNALWTVIWRMWIPAIFFVLIFKLLWGWPLSEWKKGDRKSALRNGASLLVVALPRVALFVLFGWSALWILLPMTYVFVFLDENVSVPQHSGYFPYTSETHPRPLRPWEHVEITRTTNRPGIAGVLLSLNFSLHTEHHLFPTVPWYRLPRVSEKIADRDDYQQVNFLRFMVDVRSRSPLELYTNAVPDESNSGSGLVVGTASREV